MKKRTLAYLVAAAACCAALVGGTLAYFTDTDSQDNVFTTGNVSIDLEETFTQESLLVPGVDITKQIRVVNDGTMPAYVRVHMAIPSMLDSGSEDEPQYAAYNNTLHWNFSKASVQEGQWSQLQNATQVGPNANYPNWPTNGGTYNMYQQEVGGILYNVYVITYESVLDAGATTATNAIEKVYLDAGVTQEMMQNDEKTGIVDVLGNKPKILVVAEGCQVNTFADAYTALDTCFGVPGTYNPWA